MNNCPRCSSELSKYAKVCPRCGLPVDQMEEFKKRFNLSAEEREEEIKPKAITKEEKRRQKQEKKQAKKQAKKEQKERESKSDTDFVEFTGTDDEELTYSDNYAERKRKRNKKKNRLSFEVDKDGKFNIDTSDVEIVGAETGKIIDDRFEQSYSVKKSRGDYSEPKIKWWEIYKLADRYFARRKIKKQVAKAARIRPSFIKKSKLLLLAIFFGWTGAHNFYAKNKRKGWLSLICLFVWVIIGGLGMYGVPVFSSIYISVAGAAGFITLFIWITDIVNICFNKFKYRLQIDKFISEMNVETRAKLGEKYIDLDLYHSPWWNRVKVWWQKKRRNYDERKRDRRQANIDRQKRKAAEAEEKAKIENEIYEFEQKENLDKKDKVQTEEVLEKNANYSKNTENSGQKRKKMVKSSNEESQPEGAENEELGESKSADAEDLEQNILNDGANSQKEDLEKDDLVGQGVAKKTTAKANVSPAKKYAKTVKNTKAAAKKKKKK